MQPDDNDKSFWLALIRNISPVNFPTRHIYQSSVSAKAITPQEHRYYAAKQDFSTYSKALENYSHGGIDKNTMRKFKREEFAVEATLDLHGKTETAAYEAVNDFIPRCFSNRKRCVCIITGKGLNVSDDSDIFATKGILRQLVPQWLNQPHLRGMILIFKHPSERLGGLGAIYILLRRNQNK